MAVKELPKGIDPDTVRAMIARAHENYHTIEAYWDKLLPDHEGEWIAAHDGDFVLGRTLEEVISLAREKDWPLAMIAIDQLRVERPNILLQPLIRGYFTPTHPALRRTYIPNHPPVPLVDSVIWVPELGQGTGIEVTFLVDTGADMTTLHPQDSLRLLPTSSHWDWLRTKQPIGIGGAGQGVAHYPVDAWIILKHEDGALDGWDLKVYIPEVTMANMQYESLLGRAIIGHYIATFDQLSGFRFETPS